MLFSLPLRTKRDAVTVRLRARQIAKLLMFDPVEQACIAAGAFAIAVQALRWNKRGRMCLQLERDTLSVFAQCSKEAWPSLRLSKPLPTGRGTRAQEDIGWTLQQLENLAPVDLFEEFQAQNQDTLTLLHALQRAQEELKTQRQPTVPAAAA